MLAGESLFFLLRGAGVRVGGQKDLRTWYRGPAKSQTKSALHS